jgi:hypothetical protein
MHRRLLPLSIPADLLAGLIHGGGERAAGSSRPDRALYRKTTEIDIVVVA